MNSDDIYKIHNELGFPSISEKEQADILIWHDPEIINKLTLNFKAEYIPSEVARQYIKLTKEKFKGFFVASGYIEKLNDIHLKYPKLDSQWVEKTQSSNYVLKVQERGGFVHIEHFETYDCVIEYFVDKLFKTYDR